MKYRVALWASAGFLVSVAWGFYFTYADKASPIGPLVYTLTRLTEPIVAIIVPYLDFPVGVNSVVAANTATYALVGLIVEAIRLRRRPRVNSGFGS